LKFIVWPYLVKITHLNTMCLILSKMMLHPWQIKPQENLMKKLISSLIAFISLSAFANNLMTPINQEFQVTNLESLNQAVKLFNEMKTKTTRFSQCYNRAMVWSYDMFADHGIVSEKVLIYYTNKYRKEIDRKWGFHIAPLVTVQGEQYAMDREFHKKPYKIKDWVKWFVGYGEQKLT